MDFYDSSLIYLEVSNVIRKEIDYTKNYVCLTRQGCCDLLARTIIVENRFLHIWKFKF